MFIPCIIILKTADNFQAANFQKPNAKVAQLLLQDVQTFMVISLIKQKKRPAKVWELLCGDGSGTWEGNYKGNRQYRLLQVSDKMHH